MRIRLLTIANKAPNWVQAGYEEYAKRLPAFCSLELVEIPAEKRTANADIKRLREKEAEKLLTSIKPGNHIIALDVKGNAWSTEELSIQLAHWLQQGRDIDLLIGGADGLTQYCLNKAEIRWSLSPLTFPHMLVRIIVAEQLYRAYSILQQHPYHRR